MKKFLLYFSISLGLLFIDRGKIFGQSITFPATNTYTYGAAVTLTPTITGGTATNGTLNAGTLPTGLTVGTNGTITGNPSQVGTFANIKVRVRIGATNYTSNAFTITVNQAPLTITATGPLKPYGTALTTGASATNFTYSGTVLGQTVASVTLTPNAAGMSSTTSIGSAYTVTPSAPTGTGGFSTTNYSITYVVYNGTVTTGNLNITANVLKVYGTTLTGVVGFTGFTATGLATGETIGSVTVTYGTGSAATDAAGAYTNQVTVSAATGGTFNPANYNITYSTGTITVTKAPLSITANNQSKTYGTTFTFAGTEFTVSGLLNSDAVTSATLTSTGSGSTANAGTYNIVPSAAVGTGLTNYTITYVNGTMTVGQAPLTITATGPLKPYGTTITAGPGTTNFTASGAIAGQTVTSVTLTPDANGASPTTPVGSPYVITPSAPTGTGGFLASNYSITFIQYNGTVTTGNLTITANVSKVYGTALTGGAGFAGFTVTGLAAGETIGSVTVAYGAGSAVTDPAGTYANQTTVSGATGGTFNPSNYNITYNTGTITVTTAPLTITANNQSKTFGSLFTFAGTEFTTSGLLNSDAVNTVTLTSTGSAATANAGAYNIVPGAATGSGLANYAITYVNGTMTVNTALLTITANTNNKPYGTTLTGGTGSTAFTSSGLQNGNTIGSVTVAYGTGSASNAAEGTYTNQVTISAATGGTFTASNYSISYVQGNIIVGLGNLIITANGVSKVYSNTLTGGTGFTTGFTPTGLAAGETVGSVTMVYGTGSASNAAVGTYPNQVTPSAATGGTFNPANYNITYVSGTITVTRETIKITATGPAKTFGTAFTNATYTTDFSVTTGTLATGDAITSVFLTFNAAGQSATTAAGSTYTVTPSAQVGLSATNYTITYGTFTGTVAQAPLTITASTNNKPYGTTLTNGNITTGFTVSGLQNGNQVNRVTAAYGTGAAANAATGTYSGQISLSNPTATGGNTFVASNYSITYFAGDIVVGQATLTITANSVTKTFGATLTGGPGSTAFTATGLAAGETIGSVTITYGTGSASTDAVGSYPNQVVPSAATGGTFNPANYNIIYADGTITVNPQPPSLTYNTPNVYPVNVAISTLSPNTSGGGAVAAQGLNTGTNLTVTPNFNGPQGMAFDAAGNLYVVNNNGTIKVFNPSGTYTGTFGSGLTDPVGMVFDASGNAYVLDANKNKVYEFNSGGTLINTLSVTGLNAASGIAIDGSGNLYIANTGGDDVLEVNAGTGAIIKTITSNVYNPTGVAIDNSGNIYVTNSFYLFSISSTVTKYTPNGAYSSTFKTDALGNFSTVTVDDSGNILVADNSILYESVYQYTSAGTATKTIGGWSAPDGIAVDSKGDLFVSDKNNNTVTEFGPTGGYYISGPLPPGLSFSNTTGQITGTPTAAFPTTSYTVTAYNVSGSGTSNTFTITCAYPPSFTYTTPQTYTDGVAIATLNPIFAIPNGGGPLTSATVTTNGPLPAGLTLNPDGTITGTPTVVSGPVTYTITGTNAAGLTGTATVTITCNPAAPHISYFTPDVYNVGTPVTLIPTNTGGVATWSISPGLPPGLNFDTTTGIISGTPTAVSANTNYTVTATNVTGSSTCVVTIEVNSEAPIISYITPDTYTVGNVIVPLVPTNTGSPAVSWSISAPLPSGLNFDTTTGIITGTPTVVSAATNYTVTATNAGGNSMFVINIACVNPGPILTYTTPDIFPVGIAISPLTPVNTGTTPTVYAISPGLPAGLNFDTTTGIISGTPTAASTATSYLVTATDAGSNTGTATISIACIGANDWAGGTSTDWTDATNWALGTVPTATDVAAIGANVPFTNFPNLLAGAGTISVGSVIIGTNGGRAGGVVVNSGSTLSVAGTITYQSDANAGLGYTATLSGAGSITAAGINVTANTTLGSGYTETMASSVNSLALSGNLSLTSTDVSGNDFNATFNVTGGITSIGGAVQTSNTANGTSTLSVNSATLQLAGASALAGLSATGTNTISFNNAGATIEYSGIGQTYYTDAGITGLASGVTYNSIKFSGSGVKSPNGTNANNLKITGDFTNALTTNDASDYIDLSLPSVNFNGTTQNIYGGNGIGTKFYNITFSNTGTATIQSGSVAVASIGVLTMSGGSATLAAGGLLTLNSDINGTATVAPIPAGCSITGTVNAQRFITGGAYNYRGYRLVSSPVYGSNDGASNIYSINYLINTVYLKGSAGTAGGWDAAGNPNVYLFRENLAGTNQTFSSGNFRSVNTIGFAPNFNYLVDNDPGTFNIPVGDGYMFFFRGDRSQASFATETNTTYIPTNATLTASGTLNQGQVTVSDWYTPTSANLGWTTTPGNTAVQGYNLVGNPYASSIDWDQFQTTTSTNGIYAPSVNPFIYIIDPVSNNYNVYQAGSGGVGTILPSMSNIIPSGQGFFVQASSASAQLVFNESAKTNIQANAANGNLLMGHPPKATVITQYLHLKIAKDSINTDGILISFKSNSSNQYVPAEDAKYRNGNGSVSLSSMSSDNVALAINSMPLPEVANTQTIIPLTVNGATDGTYQIQMEAIKSIPALFNIWLKDAYRSDSLDMRANSTYLFDILHSDTNSYGAHRFALIMGENQALMVHLLSFGASKIQGGDQVVWTTENEQNYTNFTVERSTDAGTTFNDLGGFVSSGQGTYDYLDKTPVNGANQYRLKIVDINGTVTYSNVVTIMYANTNGQIAINGLMVYPNPTAGTVHLSIPTNQGTTTKPNYSIEIVNNLGSVIKSATSSSPLWESDVTSLTPGTYFIRVIDTSNNTVVGKSAFVKL